MFWVLFLHATPIIAIFVVFCDFIRQSTQFSTIFFILVCSIWEPTQTAGSALPSTRNIFAISVVTTLLFCFITEISIPWGRMVWYRLVMWFFKTIVRPIIGYCILSIKLVTIGTVCTTMRTACFTIGPCVAILIATIGTSARVRLPCEPLLPWEADSSQPGIYLP